MSVSPNFCVGNGGVVPALTTGNTPVAPPPKINAPIAAAPTTATVITTPAAPPALPAPSSIVPAATTQAAIYSQFRIINPVVKLP